MMMIGSDMVDISLYALIDPERSGGRELPDLTRLVVDGGATLLQLRDKYASTRDMVARARAIRSAVSGRGIPLLINDRVDVALASGAEGVHVGQDDMSVEDARRLLGPKAIIGLSITKMEHVEAAPLDLLDYVCIGAVFATTSKDDAGKPIGLRGLSELARAIRLRNAIIPIGAISGIDHTNTADVIDAGVDGVAVISALSMASDPAVATRELKAVVDEALSIRRVA